MRTTLRIDAALLKQLRERSLRDGVSMTRLANQLLRLGLRAKPQKKARFHEKAVALGKAPVDLSKSLSLSSSLEDDEVIRKIALRK